MIISTVIAASLAAQPAPAPDAKDAPAPAAEKAMACCKDMADGKGCCCCKGKAAEGAGEEHAGHGGEAGGHAH